MYDLHAADFNNLDAQWNSLTALLPSQDAEWMTSVYRIAEEVHRGQKRKTAPNAADVPYLVHPVRVANLVVQEWKFYDFQMMAAALLHDVIEDAPKEMQEALPNTIRMTAGKEVLDAVFTLTKPELPEPCPPDAKAQRDARYFAAIRAAPEWVRLIKCADRVDNLRDALRWGNEHFWAKYSSETLGWHLWIARQTSPLAERALFKVLVEGERTIRGRVPVWVDGNLVDPAAAVLLPKHAALETNSVCIAMRGDTLIVGIVPPITPQTLQSLRLATGKTIESIAITPEALQDAHAAQLYGTAK